MSERERQVKLREERNGRDSRHLWAWVDAQGRLHVDGQDLGPSTAMVSSDGEYEWFQTIAAEHLPRLICLLGGKPGDDLLDLLEARWTGPRAAGFEKLLRESGIPVERVTF